MQNASDMTKSEEASVGSACIALPRFDVRVESGQLAVRSALAQIIVKLEALSLDQEEISTVELVLAETLNNVVEHAYPTSEGSGPINICCRHLADGLHFTVRDFGRAMPNNETPLGQLSAFDDDIQVLPEGGFGWFLIKDLAKDVRYARDGNENRLDLRIAVGYGAAV